MSEEKERCSLGALALASLHLGVVAFGGLGAALKLMQHDFVERRQWLTARDLSDALAYTKPLPGSTVVQVATFLGWRLHRWPGALIVTFGFLAPSIAMMTAGAALTYALPDTPLVRGAFTGLQVAVVGLLISAMWKLARSEAASFLLSMVLLGAFAAGLLVNAAVIVIGAGLIGIVVDRRVRRA